MSPEVREVVETVVGLAVMGLALLGIFWWLQRSNAVIRKREERENARQHPTPKP